MELITEQFVGPFEMEVVPANRKVFPDATMLLPATEEVGKKIMEALEIESSIICFQVSAFNPPLHSKHKCYLRRRGGIAECVPAGWAVIKAPHWTTTPRLTTFDLVFNPDGRGRFIARNPLTGQTVLPHKEWKLPNPDGEGRITIPAGQAEIRPTASRTFWIAGEPGTLALISEHQLEAYDATNGDSDKPKRDPFAYAEQFRLFDQWYTAFEILGDPLAGLLIEVDKRSGNAAMAFNLQMVVDRIANDTGEFQTWMSRELLPLLHPDFLDGRDMSIATRLKIMDIAEMTRNESLRLIEWYAAWANSILSDFRQRMATGASLKLKIPAIIAESGKKEARKPRKGKLIDLKRADMEKMLFQPPKPKGKPKDEKPAKDVQADVTPTTPPADISAQQTTRRGRKALAEHTNMPIAADVVAQLANLREKLGDTDTKPKPKSDKPEKKKTGSKKPSLNAPCRCGASHRRKGFEGEMFQTCPKGRSDKLD